MPVGLLLGVQPLVVNWQVWFCTSRATTVAVVTSVEKLLLMLTLVR
jgi:hypothetical protein